LLPIAYVIENKNHIVAIHQPNFLPWPGYFHKINCCDRFIFHDDIQLQWNGFTRRVRLPVTFRSRQTRWVNLPVSPADRLKPIHEISIDTGSPQLISILQTIKGIYGGAPCFKQVFPLIERCILQQEPRLNHYNANCIRTLCDALGIELSYQWAHQMDVKGHSTEKICKLVKKCHSDHYLSGTGGLNYLDKDLLKKNHMRVAIVDSKKDLDKVAASNPELNTDVTIVDWLMRMGIAQVGEILQSIKSKRL